MSIKLHYYRLLYPHIFIEIRPPKYIGTDKSEPKEQKFAKKLSIKQL